MICFLLFFFAEFVKIVIAKYCPDHIKVKIDFDKEDTEDNKGSKSNEGRKAKPMYRQKMPAYWQMSAHDLKKIAEMEGLPREVVLKADLIEALVELSR